MKRTIKIVVCSVNESKIASVKEFFKHQLKALYHCEIIGIKTNSMVNPIPISKEGIRGCNNRINCVNFDCDIKVAFEGTFMKKYDKFWMQDVVVVEWYAMNPHRIIGGGHMFEIPFSAYQCAKIGLSFHSAIVEIANATQKSQKEKEKITIAGIVTDNNFNRVETQIKALEDAFNQLDGKSKECKFANSYCYKINEQGPQCKENFNKLDQACKLLLKNKRKSIT